MQGIWNSKFIFWNFVGLLVLKSLTLSSPQLAQLVLEGPVFAPQEIIEYTNIFRADQSLPLLQESSVLNSAARSKLEDMVRNQYFAHVSPSGVSPWYWFQVSGYVYSHAGENLAIGFPAAKDVVDAWIQSPSHRNNLANSSFKEIGVAVANTTINGNSGILVVQLFGTPSNPPRITVSGSDAKAPLSLGLSQSDASEETPLPSVSPEPSPIIVSTPVSVAQVSVTPMPVGSAAPQITSTERTPITARLLRLLNQGFVLYAYFLVLIALGYILFKELKKEYLVKTAFHLILLLLAAAVPMLTLVQQFRIG